MLLDKRDLQWGDNLYISLPVRVSAGKSAGVGAAGEEEGECVLLYLPAVVGQ
jgi:hypothetical protein